jgi:hypothetical protein
VPWPLPKGRGRAEERQTSGIEARARQDGPHEESRASDDRPWRGDDDLCTLLEVDAILLIVLGVGVVREAVDVHPERGEGRGRRRRSVVNRQLGRRDLEHSGRAREPVACAAGDRLPGKEESEKKEQVDVDRRLAATSWLKGCGAARAGSVLVRRRQSPVASSRMS